MNDLILSVGDLLRSADPLSELVKDLDLALPELDPDLRPQSNLKATLTLRKVGDSIGALLTDGQIVLEVPCRRCLRPLLQEVALTPSERYFHPVGQVPADEEGEEFLLGEDGQSIDIQELLRQELLLALPIDPICSAKCQVDAKHQAQGKAGKDKHQPLAELTDLWQSQQEPEA